MPNIKAVVLDISKHDKNKFLSFSDQEFDKQLEILKTKIYEVCSKLDKEKSDQDQWYIVWREYGLTHKGYRFLTQQQKNKLKEVMCAITKEYQKLTIIAGSVATQRLVNRHTQSEKIKGSVIEDEFGRTTDISTIPPNQLTDILTLVRNTSYVFFNGKCIDRHDKCVGLLETKNIVCEETKDSTQKTTVVYRPGNKEKNGPYIKQKNIGVELCIEHADGVMMSYMYDDDDMELKLDVPDIQFVASASITLNMRSFLSPIIIQADSLHPPTLIINNSETNINVSLQSYDVLSEKSALCDIEPHIVKNHEIVSRLLTILNSMNSNGYLQRFLNANQSCLKQLVENEYNDLISALTKKYERAQGQRLKNILALLYDLLRTPTDDEIIRKILTIALKRQHTKMMEFIIKKFNPSSALLASIVTGERPEAASPSNYSSPHHRFYKPVNDTDFSLPHVSTCSSHVPADYIPLFLEQTGHVPKSSRHF